MSKELRIKKYIHQLEVNFSKELPRIKNEVKLYEKKLKEDKLIRNPKASPQFNA